MPVIIKGKMFSHKSPMVCVSIMDHDKAGIIERAKTLIADGVDIIEWRMDFFEGYKDPEAVRDVFNDLRPLITNTILLATLRSKAQGGHGDFETEDEILYFLDDVSKAHVADIIDVEFFAFTRPKDIIQMLQGRGALVLTSHHDHTSTPRIPVMKTTLDRMAEADADIVKIAVMPTKPSDVLDLLKVTDEFLSDHPDMPIISISMGTLGMLSRISGEIFGSCVTFGALGGESAPGQLQTEDLRRAISFIHKYSGDWT